VEPTYANVAGLLHGFAAPTYIVPGDNEWNDCADPDAAWALWTKYFLAFEQAWPDAPPTVHQAVRTENMAFVAGGTLFVGVNLPGGKVQDAAEWSLRMQQDGDWVAEQLALHADDVVAAVVFAQAEPAAVHAPFVTAMRAAVASFGKPAMYLCGDGHVFKVQHPWPEPNLLFVEVPAGGAKPLHITVAPSTPDGFLIDPAPF